VKRIAKILMCNGLRESRRVARPVLFL